MLSYLNGYVLYPLMERYSKRNISDKVLQLKSFENLSVDAQRALQRAELAKFLEYCAENIPYYTELFRKCHFDHAKVLTDIRYIQDLPLLTKDIIREQGERIKAPNACHVRKTGGSTGQSVYFYYDTEGLDWTAAINLMAYEMAGKKPHHSDCHIASEVGLQPVAYKYQLMDMAKLFVQNRKRLMIDSFSDRELESVFKNLKRISPYLVQGHPSSMYALAVYAEKNQKRAPRIPVFEPSGEMLTEKMVEAIERVFKCRVANRYGNAEFGVVAHSLPTDNYRRLKVFSRAFYVEEINQASLIVTNFTNRGFPLLRYDTGDVATVKQESGGEFVYDIQGRVHDLVTINNKQYPTHFIMDYLDHKVRHVREFQIKIREGKNPVLHVVPENLEDQERIRREVLSYWPEGLDLEFVNYEEFKTVGWRKKFRHVIYGD